MSARLMDKGMVKRLQETNPAEPEVIEAARAIIQEVITLGLPTKNGILAGVGASMTRRVYTTQFDTMAVSLGSDGYPYLLINPEFCVSLGIEGALFVISHEIHHLIMAHLHVDQFLNSQPMWTLASEACINWRVMRVLGCKMPLADGKESGINPKTVYDDYRKDLKSQGLEPLDRIEKLFATDLGCYAELSRMTKPPKEKQQFCLHGGDGEQGESGEGGGKPTLDLDAASALGQQLLEVALHEAVAHGNRKAKEELLALMEATGDSDSASKAWGDLGANRLRGETTTTRKTDQWERWTDDAIATRLRDGEKLRYNKKVPWDPRVSPRGREPMKYGVVGVDTSGSMAEALLTKIAAMVQEHDNLEIIWVAWDGVVNEFKPGEAMIGGGGTNCQLFDDWIFAKVEEGYLESDPDFVLCITDGYFTHFTPRDPDAWIWLITPDGDSWPETWSPPMSTRVIDIV